MKKTLIALTVAASAAVSTSAMAWTATGTGGTVNLSGTLTPENNVTPWEVKVGASVTNLDARIKKDQTEIRMHVKTAIPVLGIRFSEKQLFSGKTGISPQIDYGSAVNINNFENNQVPLILDVKDANDRKIGSLATALTAGAWGGYSYQQWYSDNGVWKADWKQSFLVAQSVGDGFYGGLPKASGNNDFNIRSRLKAMIPDIADNYHLASSNELNYPMAMNFAESRHEYNAYYGSGIEADKEIVITLDSPAQNDASIVWKATLPILVFYR